MSASKSTELVLEREQHAGGGFVWLCTGKQRFDGVPLGMGRDLLGAYDSAIEELEGQIEAARSQRAALAEEQARCDHKMVDSRHCLKCGWLPPLTKEAQVRR
jgi:hypothetical protein